MLVVILQDLSVVRNMLNVPSDWVLGLMHVFHLESRFKCWFKYLFIFGIMVVLH